MCIWCERIGHEYEKLPHWNLNRNKEKWTPKIDHHYWHPEKEYRILAYAHNDSIFFCRACDKCGKNTKNQAHSTCTKRVCGGLGERQVLCTHTSIDCDGNVTFCSSLSHYHKNGQHLCRPHYAERYPEHACKRCRKLPKLVRDDTDYCFNCFNYYYKNRKRPQSRRQFGRARRPRREHVEETETRPESKLLEQQIDATPEVAVMEDFSDIFESFPGIDELTPASCFVSLQTAPA